VRCADLIYIDLDGSLTYTDTLWESLATGLRRAPGASLLACFSVLSGRAALKARLAAFGAPQPESLPLREPLMEWLKTQHAQGAQLILASAADSRVVGPVAMHMEQAHRLPMRSLSSDGTINRKSAVKLEAIQADAGLRTWAYVGNSTDDIVIFQKAHAVVVCGDERGVVAAAQATGKLVAQFSEPPQGKGPIAALRPHQWLKNLLIFVPVLTAFKFLDAAVMWQALIAFIAFGAAASAGYIINDLLDLASDRMHPRKRLRPFASGRVSVLAGFGMALGLLVLAAGSALAVGPHRWALLGWVLAYLGLTLSYSIWIKRRAVSDVLTLALLYTLRVVAGAAATGIKLSFWLLAFTAFLFVALAMVKRSGELIAQRDRGEATASGRGYQVADLAVLMPLGQACSVAAVMVLALYVNAPEQAMRYAQPQALWLMLMGLLAWQFRLWLATSRGLMHDDPLVYALGDRSSWALISLMGLGFGAAVVGW
jgi:4-hydroxybenzoate polyprenyltransferase